MKVFSSTGLWITLFSILLLSSCFKEIDTEALPLPEVEDFFSVKHSIKQIQSYHKFYETSVLEVDTTRNTRWDLAFESAGEGSRVMLGWASFSIGAPTGKYDFAEITQELILEMIDSADWVFDDPTFVNEPDSLALTGHWENGEIWIQSRGTTSDNYYAIQYVSADEESYTFRYASAQSLGEVKEATVYRASAYNYVYFSYGTERAMSFEPNYLEWDILFTPYRGWWETDNPGIFAPFNMSGIMINNEVGVRVAFEFDPEVYFSQIDMAAVSGYEFTDQKGAIGASWKKLGDPESGNIFSMDTTMKYILSLPDPDSEEVHFYKMRMIDYRNEEGEDHYPTVEFSYLGSN